MLARTPALSQVTLATIAGWTTAISCCAHPPGGGPAESEVERRGDAAGIEAPHATDAPRAPNAPHATDAPHATHATDAASVLARTPGALDVPITVKEVAGVGAVEYPVAVVVPLPRGVYQDPAVFRLVDDGGRAVAAQFEVLNRHWARDRSIRHLMVHFQPTVAAWTGGSGGTRQYHLRADGENPRPARPATVRQEGHATIVSSGAVTIRIESSPFRIITPTGALELLLHDRAGVEQRSFDTRDVTVEVEERGPMRAVVRAESGAVFNGPGDIRHGWALRVYVYAGKPFVKLDLQLQNSARNTVYSGPLYFDDFVARLPSGGRASATEVRADRSVPDPLTAPAGALATQGVQVVLRNFWQLWPSGLAVDAAGTISIQMFPSFGAKRWQGAPSPTGLYWLEDMQHVAKESLLNFGALDASELGKLAKTFQLHPVGVVPVEWYAATEVTLDMGGYFPRRTPLPNPERRLPDYARYGAETGLALEGKLGWDSFGIDLLRKDAPATTGGWPYSVARYFLTGDPADYWLAEDFAMGELNVRPQWMTGYNYKRDYPRLALSENPYSGWSWRKFDGRYGYDPMPGHIPGSGQDTKPRDDHHAWFYHVEEAYYATGNLWIRDWYRFIAEFRKARLHERDPFPALAARAVGHSLAHALQAFRVTGDMEIPPLVASYLRNHLRPLLDPKIGSYKPREDFQGEAVFQVGYLCRAIISYVEDLAERDPVALDIIRGFVRWNVGDASFGYYVATGAKNAESSGTAMTFADPQAWYAVLAGDRAALDQLAAYVTTGLGGGERPYVNLRDWTGDYNGRITSAALTMHR